MQKKRSAKAERQCVLSFINVDIRNPLQFIRCILQTKMRAGIQRYTDTRMSIRYWRSAKEHHPCQTEQASCPQDPGYTGSLYQIRNPNLYRVPCGRFRKNMLPTAPIKKIAPHTLIKVLCLLISLSHISPYLKSSHSEQNHPRFPPSDRFHFRLLPAASQNLHFLSSILLPHQDPSHKWL